MSSSATVKVEKATSDLLMGPDWTLNMDICDSVNSDHWQAKDVVKAVKRRLQNKNPKVQFLALTLLETMMKNSGDYVHFQVVERDILQEMVKIVKKKTDMQVRDKILVMLDSWQEAFGGPGGKYPQFYLAYMDLKRTGVEFPRRSPDSALIFTPPASHAPPVPIIPQANYGMPNQAAYGMPTQAGYGMPSQAGYRMPSQAGYGMPSQAGYGMLSQAGYGTPSQVGYGMPTSSSLRLEEAMASDMANLSLSDLDSMRSVMELLSDMLEAVNPNDRGAVKDEVITDLVSQCHSNQKRLVHLIDLTRDEELLGEALALNDTLQGLLAKHDAIASGSPLPAEVSKSSSGPSTPVAPTPSAPVAPTPSVTNQFEDEAEEEDDDFAQLARRHLKKPSSDQSTPSVTSDHVALPNHSDAMGATASTSTAEASSSFSGASNALTLPDPPTPVRTVTKEQDMIELLSITLTSNLSPPHTPATPPMAANQDGSAAPVSPNGQGFPYNPQAYAVNQGNVPYNSYVAPWAQPQPQSPLPHQSRPQSPHPPQRQPQPQPQPQLSLDSSSYPPPPWATPANSNPNPYAITTNQTANTPVNAARPLQHYGSFGSRVNSGPTTAPKPYISSNRLFEDLIELRNPDGSVKTSSTASGLSSSSSQDMISGRK